MSLPIPDQACSVTDCLRCLAIVLVLPACAAAAAGPDSTAAPIWLLARADSLLAATPAGEFAASYPDTLLTLADELTAHRQHERSVRARELAGMQAFRGSDLARALTIWQEGLAYARAHNERERESSLLNALAVGYAVTDCGEAAVATYGESLALKSVLGDTIGLGRTWGNLASTYAELGRVAESFAASAEAERWNRLSGDRRSRVGTLITRAGLLGQLGRHHEALAQADTALALADSLGMVDGRGVATLRRVEGLMALGRLSEALMAVESALATLDPVGARYYSLYAHQRRVDLLRRLKRLDEAAVALAAFRVALTAGEVPRLRTMERFFSGLLAIDTGHVAAAEAALAEAVASFEQRRANHDDPADRAGAFHAGGDVYGALALARLAHGDTLGAWRATERGQAMLLREQVTVAPIVDLTAVQSVLMRADAILVQASETSTEPLVWFVVTPTGLHSVAAAHPDAYTDQARALLASLAAGESLSRAAPLLQRLGEALLAPLGPWLGTGVTERIYLVPPVALTGLPLEVLPLPGENEPVGDRIAITYVTSATLLVHVVDIQPSADGMLALADPAPPVVDGLPARPATPLPADPMRRLFAVPLPEARTEVRALALPGSIIAMGPEANLALFTQRAGEVAVIHLATHAVSDPLDGRRSTLLLASDTPVGEPAALTAAACETLTLRADLTVLSACRSGLGHALLGEGTFGLPRSFLQAGSRSVLSSLWDVEDRATRRFMETFYRELRAGRSRDLALRETRRALAAQGVPPRDWAGFVLTGVGHEPVASLVGQSTLAGRQARRRGLLAAGAVLVAVAVVAATCLERIRRRSRLT